MKSAAVWVMILICFAGYVWESSASDEPPLYQKFYEEGFYDTAIALLDSLIAADSAGSGELLRAAAFCHIARGDRETGASIFGQLLDRHPAFRLDTLLTPPKILEVFLSVVEQRDALRRASDSLLGVKAPPAVEPLQSVTTESRPETAAPAVRFSRPEVPLLLVKYSMGFLPGGAGQFHHRQWLKGALLLTAQVASFAVCAWSYHTRQECYDDRYGWHQGNMAAYNRYTGYARLGSAVFIAVYTLSVIDYFSIMHKKRIPSGHR